MLDFLLGLVGSGIDAGFQRRQQERQNAFNAQQAQISRDFASQEASKQRNWSTSEREATQEWNLEQWNRENEYNSPSAQLDRLLAAGINPNSAFQSMSNVSPGSVRTSAGSGASASGATASSAGMFNTNFGQAFQRYNESKMLNAQIQGQEESNRGLKITNDNLQRAYDADYDEKQESISNLKKLGEKYGIEINISKIEEDITEENFNFIRDSFQTRLAQLSEELKKTQNEVKLQGEQIETEELRQNELRASIDLKKEEKLGAYARRKADEFANDIFFRTGIRPTDGQTSVFARAYELTLEGKVEDGQHLLTNYYRYLGKVRDNTQFPTLDKVGTDIISPVVPEIKQEVSKGIRRLFGLGQPAGYSTWNPDSIRKNYGKLMYNPIKYRY